MRTTLDINDELLRRAKQRAAEKRIPLREVVENSLRLYLNPSSPSRPYKFQWKTEKGRLRAGVRIEDRESLYEIMEGRE